ncbi:MAG: LysM peptidoglycan-binding domain-containing protein [Bacteroidales bacterium]|nr:LysM peptidoglycan-binding domain-containing protein [Bacteroidales bacterium]HOI32556.1 LysM peptidoglycan-binding domain-containing protein [Bacteroidales bacterium]
MKQYGILIKLIIILISANILLPCCFAGAQTTVTKSSVIEQYNGMSYYLHTVQPKQTLYSISKAYNVDLKLIEQANPTVTNSLRANQVIRIPAGNKLAEDSYPNKQEVSVSVSTNDDSPENLPDIARDYETIYHVAGRNETFSYIADIYLVPVNNIRLANPGMKEPIEEGEYVLVPITPKEKRPPVTNEQRFLRSDFDPFNPASRTNDANTKAQSSFLTESVKPEQDRPISVTQIAPQDDSRQPKMVEPFAVSEPEATNPSTSQADKQILTSGMQYVVKPGETLYSISRSLQIPMDNLVTANPGIANGVKAGQVLLIPQKPAQAEQAISNPQKADTTITHIVKKGETLYRISRNYAVSIDEIKKLNPGLATTINIGQKIVLPKKKITEPFVLFEVKSSQRTKHLARDFEVESEEIYALNPGVGRKVYPGQTLKIPLLDHVEISPVQPEPIETPEVIEVEETEPEQPFAALDCFRDRDYSDFEFKVALLLPLYLDEARQLLKESAQNADPELLKSQKAFSFLSFYRGFILAADSMARSQGMKLVVKSFDVDNSVNKANAALADPFLCEAHLIIGPLFSKAFDVVAPFALSQQIPIVNPFAQRNEIVMNNPAVIKLKPSEEEQYTQLAELLRTKYSNAKIFLYQAHQFTQSREMTAIREKINAVVPNQVSIPKHDILQLIKERSRKMDLKDQLVPFISIEGHTFYTADIESNPLDSIVLPNPVSTMIYAIDSVRTFRNQASAVRENVVIVLSDNNVFATEFVNKFNKVADTFSLTMIGLPEWEQFDQLFNENLMKMKAIYFTSNYINYSDYYTQMFINQYRKRYASEPDNYAFEAFDMGWYFLNALKYLGPRPMPCISQFQIPLLQTQFFLNSSQPEKGYENSYWNIYQYKHFRREPIPNAYFLNQKR